jgi:preprotein translocase subunit SecG
VKPDIFILIQFFLGYISKARKTEKGKKKKEKKKKKKLKGRPPLERPT